MFALWKCVIVCVEGTVIRTCLDSRRMAGLNTLQLHIHLQVIYVTLCVYLLVCQGLNACAFVCPSMFFSNHFSVSVYGYLFASAPKGILDMTVHDIVKWIICLFYVSFLCHICDSQEEWRESKGFPLPSLTFR